MAVPPKNCFTMTWKIENFSMCPKKQQESISSPIFQEFYHKTSWQLMLYPRGKRYAGSIACYLFRNEATQTSEKIFICAEISIYSVNPKINYKKLLKETFKNGTIVGFFKFLTLDSLKKCEDSILSNDVLTIKCKMWFPNVDNKAFRSNNYITQCSVQTKIRTSTISVFWPIQCSALVSEKEVSRRVISVFDHQRLFLLTAYFTGASTNDPCVKIVIQTDEDFSSKVFVKCRVSVLDELEKYKVEDEHLFERKAKNDTWTLPTFIHISTLVEDNYFDNTDNYLNLLFRFTFSCSEHIFNVSKDESLSPSCFSIETNETLNPLQKEYKNLYKEGKFSDVTLVVENKEFRAHKCILGSRSCVFSAMFETDMAEKETGVVNITDLEASTVDLMLSFMYSNILEDITVDEALKLYSAADKYAVESLSKKCRCILKNHLSLSNVCKNLSLADLHQDKELLDAVQDFIRTNSKSIFLSQEWESFIASNSLLAARVMHKMLI